MDTSFNEEYKKMWDNRYKSEGYAYGKAPNEFFADQIIKLKPGTILMPADGEGRNGVFAAELGWEVTSVDLSEEGRFKAIKLARERHISINYIVGDLEELEFKEDSFDVIGLIYAHFSADKKSPLHHKLNKLLKPGGIIILEAFGKKHLELVLANPNVGGPKNIDMLYSTEEIIQDFGNYDLQILEEKEIKLDEGEFHIGKGSVIRFVGKKPVN